MTERLVRPYLLTGGRTRTEGVDLPLEALLTITSAGSAVMADRTSEERQLLVLSNDSKALVELAAIMELPIGVVRVLAGDLVGEGYLTQGHTAVGSAEVPLLERLLDGLKADL